MNDIDTALVSRPRPNALEELFGVSKPIIGTIHVLPLPGAPRYRGQSMREVVAQAVADARAYEDGGIDGLIVENEGDIPFLKPDEVGIETVAGLTAVSVAVREAVRVPIGINCLANAVCQSLAVAKAADARFVRANQWANAYVANEGIVEGAAARALRFRTTLRADDVRVMADVHVKHGSHAIVADRDIEQMTHDVEAFDADVLIATGQRTGDPTPREELNAIKRAASLPVLIGSGLRATNALHLMAVADGAIVGSAMKYEGVWWNAVSTERVRTIMSQIETLR